MEQHCSNGRFMNNIQQCNYVKKLIYASFLLFSTIVNAQHFVNTKQYDKKNKTTLAVTDSIISVSWPTGNDTYGKLLLDLSKDKPLFKAISSGNKTSLINIANNIDPAFILTVGKRDLVSQNGWNIFFDKVPKKPHQSYVVSLLKDSAAVITEGAHTIIRIHGMQAASFTGALEITLYNGSPLFNVAAVTVYEYRFNRYFIRCRFNKSNKRMAKHQLDEYF